MVFISLFDNLEKTLKACVHRQKYNCYDVNLNDFTIITQCNAFPFNMIVGKF